MKTLWTGFTGRVVQSIVWGMMSVSLWGAAPVHEVRHETIDDLLAYAFRYPVAGVPPAARAPTIDGELSPGEWDQAALIADLLYDSTAQSRPGLPLKSRCAVYLCYDREGLYVGYRYELPAGAEPIAGGDAAVRDSRNGAGEDVIELFLNPKGRWDSAERWQIGGNAAGVMWDREMQRNGNTRWTWNPPGNLHRIHRFPEGGGWSGEFLIRFADLPAPAPEPGALWRANFVNVRKTPVGIVSAWAYWNEWRGGTGGRIPYGLEQGWLQFLAEPVCVRFEHGGGTARRHPVALTLAGELPAAGVDVELQLFRRKDVPTARDPSLLATFAKQAREMHVGGSAMWGQTWPSITRMLFDGLTPVGEPLRQTVKPGGPREVAAPAVTEEGEYLLLYRAVTGEGDRRQILAAGSLPYRLEPEVMLDVQPLVLVHGIVLAEVDLINLESLPRAKAVRVTAIREGGQWTSPAATAAVEGQTLVTVELPVREWQNGTYTIRAEVVDAAGQGLGSATATWNRVPDPDWWVNKAGFEPEIPEPYTPIAIRTGDRQATVSVIRRDYRFDGGFLPASILATPNPWSLADTVQPIELLAEPIRLDAIRGEQALAWECTRFDVQQPSPGKAILRNSYSAGELRLETVTTIEFDGMMFVELTLSGPPEATVDAVSLVIPLRREAAQRMAKSYPAPGPGQDNSWTELNGGRYPDLSTGKTYEDTAHLFQFIFSDRVGLEVSMESTRGWRNRKPRQAIRVECEADRVTETLRLADHPTTLGTPLQVRLGFIASPVKPLLKDIGQRRYVQNYAPWPPNTGKKKDGTPYSQADLEAWYRWQKFTGVTHIGEFFAAQRQGRQWNIVPVTEADQLAIFRQRYDLAHAAGVKVMPHAGWYSIYPDTEVYANWGYEMLKQPLESTIGGTLTINYDTPFTDWYAYNVAHEARTIGIDGLRYDTMNLPMVDFSRHAGSAWTDLFGTVRGTRHIWGGREMQKRNYRLFHGGLKKDGCLVITNACYPPMFGVGFGDHYEVGEGPFEKALTLKEGYPQHLVRSLMNLWPHGGFLGPNNMKGEPLTINERLGPLLVADAHIRWMHYPHIYGRGYEIFPSSTQANSVEIWDAFAWIDRGGQALWKPYWENGDSLSIEAPRLEDGTPPELYASYYLQPGRKALIVACSYERVPLAGVKLKLDLARLGFEPGQAVYAEDSLTRMPVELDQGTMTLAFYAQRWRMIRLSTASPRYRAEQLGPNLIPWGDFETWQPGLFTFNPLKGVEEPVVHDPGKAHGGQASLKFVKSNPERVGQQVLVSPPLVLEPGSYLLQGYAWRQDPLKPLAEIEFDPYRDNAWLKVRAQGTGVDYDPPLEFANPTYLGGSWAIKESTPGWQHFALPFTVAATTDKVTIGVDLADTGTLTAWLDDLSVHRVRE